MSGRWPPEWDDPEDISGEADQQATEAESGLSEVTAYLASVPAPVMPARVEARISAALAAEAAARAGLAAPASGDSKKSGTAQSPGSIPAGETAQSPGSARLPGSARSDGAAGARVLGAVPARARVRRRRAQGRHGQRDARKVLGRFVIGPLAVCLLIAVIALGLSHAGRSSSSSSAAPGGMLGAAPAAGAASATAANGKFEPAASSAAASVPMVVPSPASSAFSSAAGFAVIESGTRYQRPTLAQQARAQVLVAQARETGPRTAPTATSTASAPSAASTSVSSSAPTAQLRACVLKVTGGMKPELVDRATYQGTPAYVVASSSHVWVVGLGCTAARPQVIVSVPIAS